MTAHPHTRSHEHNHPCRLGPRFENDYTSREEPDGTTTTLTWHCLHPTHAEGTRCTHQTAGHRYGLTTGHPGTAPDRHLYLDSSGALAEG